MSPNAETLKKTRPVFVTVNTKPVKVDGPLASGLGIKKAAIEQGVAIELDFQLALIDPDGKHQIIGDDDLVEVTSKSEFVATATDDNS
jgi:hypothetical protein